MPGRGARLRHLWVGDPACDLVVAWTLLRGEGRRAFRSAMSGDGPAPADAAMWARGRGWALWKALITAASPDVSPVEAARATRVAEQVIAEHHGWTDPQS